MRELVFRVHAIQRMFQRNITHEHIRRILEMGKMIMDYPEDQPYPSRLILGFINERPIHVVAAEDQADNTTIIITAYEPDLDLWERGFERRKKQ